MKKCPDSIASTVKDVMQQLAQSSKEHNWVIEQHDSGAQASILAVRRPDGRPIWQGYRELIVKLYKKTRPQSAEVASYQFESLSRLHAQLDGTIANGWTIDSPVPLYRCERPLALVMTKVPGKPLKSCLRTSGQVDAQTLESIADAVIAVMESYWLVEGGLYGELNFDNILCDVSRRHLSFVDPGSLEKAFRCDTIPRHWFPASRDLAYLLYDIETSIRTTIGNPGARQRQKNLAEMLLRTFAKRIGPGYRTECLLDEIGACARVHLQRIRTSWSPRGIWRHFVRRTASRSINEILGRLRSDALAHANGSCADAMLGASDDGKISRNVSGTF
jgi:hypothetical protein